MLGNFDRVHLGHSKYFSIAKEKAKEKKRTVIALSFYPHPTWVVGNQPKPLVMSRKDKKKKISKMGIDIFIEYPFDIAFSKVTPDEFFEEILVKQLQAKVVIIGSNYCFGKNKQGDITYMKKLGQKHQVEICAVDTVKYEGEPISSTRIRNLIAAGEMEKAAELLGHPYSVVGTVIHGKKLGRTIGFPTINMLAAMDRIHPPNGVYITTTRVYDREYVGITNIGYNPTVNGTQKMIETHLFDFNQMIYGEEVEVTFHQYLRKEEKFASVEKLVEQLEKDKQIAKDFLKKETFTSLQA